MIIASLIIHGRFQLQVYFLEFFSVNEKKTYCSEYANSRNLIKL